MKDRVVMDTFKDYVGIKAHFNEKDFYYSPNHYRFSRYTVQTIKKRNDCAMIVRFAERFQSDPEGRVEFLVSQFKNDKNAWIGNFSTETAKSIHNKRMKIIQSFDTLLDKDVETIVNYYQGEKSLDEILKVNFDRPLIYKELNLTDEILSLVDKIYPFENNSMNPLWSEKLSMFRKYIHFLPSYSNESKLESLKDTLHVTNGSNETSNNKNTLDHLFV